MPIIDPFDSAEQTSGGIVDPFEQQPKQQNQPKRKVGAGEAFVRGVGDSLAAIPDTINAVVGQVARPVDAVLGTNIRAMLTDPNGVVGRARQAYKINPQTEELDGAAALAQGVGALPRDLALAYMTGGAAPAATAATKIAPEAATSIAAAVRSLMPEFRRGAVAMAAPGAIQSRDAYNEATAAGAAPVDAAALGTIRGLGLMAQGALPLAKEGSLLTRAASGVPLAVAPNAVQRQLENTVAPESMQRSPSLEDDGAAGVLGAVMAAALGPRAGRVQTAQSVNADRANWNMSKFGTPEGPSIEAPVDTPPPSIDPVPNDPKAQIQRVAEALFRTGEDAPVPPSDVSLVPKAGKKDGNYTFETRSNPDPAAIPSKLTLEGDGPNRVLGDGEIRDIAKTFGMAEEAILALPRDAQIALRDHADGYQGAKRSFDLANRRQSQADMDLANRDQLAPDYQGSGAAASGGEFDSGIRGVTLLDAQMKGGKLAGGEQVEVLNPRDYPPSKDGNMTVRDGNGRVFEVEASRLSEHQIPKDQRLAQDFRARSSEPPKGVGEQTMRDEKMPRRSTDRISGDEFGGKTEFVNPTDRQVSVEGEVFRGDDNQLPNREQPQARRGDTFDMEQPTTAMSTVRGEGVRTPYDVRPTDARNQLPDNRSGIERGLPSPDSPATGGRETGTLVVDQQGTARPEIETNRQAQERIDAERKAKNVSDYSRQDLGNTARPEGVGRTDTASIPREKAPLSKADIAKERKKLGAYKMQLAKLNKALGEQNLTAEQRNKMSKQRANLEDLIAQIEGRTDTNLPVPFRGQPEAEAAPKVDEPPPRQPEEPIMGRETGDPFADEAPNPRQPEATTERTPPPPQQPRRQSDMSGQLLADIRARGGIAASEALDITGDHAASAGRRMPGVFRADGMSADGLLELLQQRQWLGPDATIDDARAMVRDAFDKREVSPFDGGAEAGYAHAEELAWKEHQWKMENDPEYRAQEEARMRDDMEAESVPQTEGDLLDHKLLSEAAAIDPDAFERAAIKYENDDAGLMREVQRIIDENSRQQDADAAQNRSGEANRGEDQGFRLEQESEAERRVREQREAEADRARQQRLDDLDAKAKADAERDSFDLTGSDRPADANKNQGDLPLDGEGGFTLSMNPFANPKAIKKALAAIFGSADEIKAHQQGLKNDIADIKRKVPNPAGNIIVRFARSVFDSSTGAIRAIAKNYKSDTFHWVIDQFHTEAGSTRTSGQTLEDAVEMQMNKHMTRLTEVLKPFGNDLDQMKQVVNRVRSGTFDSTPVGKAAKEISDMLKETLKYMRDAGVEVGEVKSGYYPREFDMGQVLGDGAGFIKAIADEYRKMGMSQADADVAARDLHDRIAYGDQGSMFNKNGGAVQTPFTKERSFGAHVDKEGHPLNKFFVADPSENITVYMQRAVRRAEIARRFGDKFSHWNNEWVDAKGKKQPSILSKLEAEGAQDAIPHLKEYVSMAAGLNRDGGAGLVRAASTLRTWGSLAFLEKATLSSLSEFITPTIRAAGASKYGFLATPADMLTSFNASIADLISRSKSAAERRAFAEDLGLISGAVSDMVSAARFSGGEPVSKIESKVLSTFFRRTGLTQWTEATRVASVEIGRVFMRRLVKQVADGDRVSVKFLKELGVPEAKVQQFAKDIAAMNDGRPQAGMLQGETGELYRNALQRFLKQSVMVPSKTTKPAWMSHPVGSVVGQLQSFNYAFYENVWKRNMKLAKEAATGKGQDGESWDMAERYRLAAPLLTMPALVGAAFAIGEGRDALLGDPNKRRDETATDKVLKAASRGAPIAPIDPIINFVSAARYNRGAVDVFAGPVVGTLGRGMDAGVGMFMHNSDKTNTAERRMAQATYDLFIEPSINFALSAAPLPIHPTSPAAAAITQYTGMGSTREMFVSAVAGKDSREGKKKPKKQ